MLPLFQEPTPPSEPDFGSECREAFVRLCIEASALPRRGHDSEKAFQRKVDAIDRVLDQFLDWCDIEAL